MTRKHGYHANGVTTPPEYKSWSGMVARCYCKTNKKFPRYGGRGIIVCEAWRTDFAAFLDYIGPRPSPKHSIDRWPDNDGNYEPGNVRWATPKQQQRNRVDNRLVDYRGQQITVSELVEISGLSRSRVRHRIDAGLTAEEAISRERLPDGALRNRSAQ